MLTRHKNTLKNKGVRFKLNPYLETHRTRKMGQMKRNGNNRHKFYNQLITDSDYQASGCQGFRTWLGLR